MTVKYNESEILVFVLLLRQYEVQQIKTPHLCCCYVVLSECNKFQVLLFLCYYFCLSEVQQILTIHCCCFNVSLSEVQQSIPHHFCSYMYISHSEMQQIVMSFFLVNLNLSSFTHLFLASHLMDIVKQCRPRSDATEHGV